MISGEIFKVVNLVYLIAIMGTRGYFLRHWMLGRKENLSKKGWLDFVQNQGWGFITFAIFIGTWLIVAIILYFLNIKVMAWAEFLIPDWIPWIGLIFAISVFPFHIWVYKTLSKAMKPTNDGKISHQLVSDGPYRSIRHPMFITTAIVLIAIALMSADLLLLLGAVGMIVLMIIWAPREEQLLIEKFEEQYRIYMEKTGRFFPKRRKN